VKRPTVRTRLTLIYGGLFLSASTAVLITVNLIIQHNIQHVRVLMYRGPAPTSPYTVSTTPPLKGELPAAGKQIIQTRHDVVTYGWFVTFGAIAVLAVLAFLVSWWLAGRILRPVHQITAAAKRLSLSSLDERIALSGPRDELKEMADTFDEMLDRLERAAASQRRFVANASHELRTPLAIQRAAIEIGMNQLSPERLARTRAELLDANERSERLIDGLLALAQGERGLDTRAPVDLETVVRQVAEPYGNVTLDLEPAVTAGDEVMLTRLVANLVENAVRYNKPGGHVLVRLNEAGLTVRNTGPRIDPDDVPGLFEPFRRGVADRTGSPGGSGLGLSIVAAIARAHTAPVTATANPEGGLTVTVAFPTLVPAYAP
jgi:signal transduction histidine kinase